MTKYYSLKEAFDCKTWLKATFHLSGENGRVLCLALASTARTFNQNLSQIFRTPSHFGLNKFAPQNSRLKSQLHDAARVVSMGKKCRWSEAAF